jgi:NAD(P)H-dependent FMN reductase
MKIEIISGSPRHGSVTKRVALHLKDKLSKEFAIDAGFIDIEQFNLPPIQSVFESPLQAPAEFRNVAERVSEADAFILVTPEYNGGYSPALKNFLDHFPKQERKVFGIVSASPGALGGVRAALQLQNLVFGLFGIGSPKMLVVPGVDKKFDEDGKLVDVGFVPAVNGFVKEFMWLANVIELASRKVSSEHVVS